MPVLVVDAANVVGSRPDGWWRDRAGAARRLHDRLRAAALPYDEVLLVLEGRARAGVPTGTAGPVRTVHAAGSGDDAIVEAAAAEREAGREVLVATADRALGARVTSLGARVLAPSVLLADLDR